MLELLVLPGTTHETHARLGLAPFTTDTKTFWLVVGLQPLYLYAFQLHSSQQTLRLVELFSEQNCRVMDPFKQGQHWQIQGLIAIRMLH